MQDSPTLHYRVHPSTRYIWLYICGFLILLLLKFMFLGEVPWFTFFWRAIVAVGGLALIYLYLCRITTIYEISSLEVALEEGIFSKVKRTVPLTHITNFELSRRWYKRLLGLADLLVDTAGSSDIELRLAEMELRDAELFSSTLSRYVHKTEAQSPARHAG